MSYVIQLEGKTTVEAQKFELELNKAPAGWARRGSMKTFVAPELLSMMGGGTA